VSAPQHDRRVALSAAIVIDSSMTSDFAPTFLLCSERSGSNLIRALLDAHSKIHAPAPVHLGRFWKGHHQYGDLSQDKNWQTLIRHVLLYLKANKYSGVLTEEELLERVRSRRFTDLYRYIHHKGMAQNGKERLFIKENQTYQYMFFLVHTFPNAKFVFQVRDPRDYVLSCKKAAMHYGSIPAAIKVWQDDQSGSLEVSYAIPQAQIFMQRYEDLVTEPEKVLRSLCAFLDVPYESTILSFYKNDKAQQTAKSSRYWENLDKPVLAANVGKFRQGLTPLEIRLVEYRLALLMRRFGYALETDPAQSSWMRRLIRLYEWGLSQRENTPGDTEANLKRRQSYVSPEQYKAMENGFSIRQEMRAEVAAIDNSVRFPY
jgi:hypothetical protein